MNDQVIKDYQDGMSINGCCRKYNLTINSVRSILSNNNIHIRNRAEQNIITNKSRAYKLNHAYFDTLDMTKAYYLGFIAADGYISDKRNVIKIALSSVDCYFLNNFKEALDFKGKITNYTTNNGFDVSEIRLTSEHMRKTLEKYSIVPRKTYKKMTMTAIPDEFKGAFIKGYFDGDGSFSHAKNTTTVIFKICAYRNELLNEFKEWFTNHFDGKYNSRIYHMNRNDGSSLYSWEMSTIPSIELLQYFYSLDTPYLLRKKQKFDDYMSFRIEKFDPRARTTFKYEVEKMC